MKTLFEPPKKPREKTETDITAEIRSALGRIEGVCVWRNNSGKLEDRHGRWVTFGLGIGSADLVGLVRVPHAIGQPGGLLGRFFALEIKSKARHVASGAALSADQERWKVHVQSLGGFVAVVWSAEEAVAAVERCRQGRES
jgi:hypothetical protein